MSGVTVSVEMVFCKPKNQATCSDKVASGCSEKIAKSGCCETAPNPTCSAPSEASCGDSCSFEPEEGLGKVTRNPFFNFLRDHRKCNQNASGKEIAVTGAEKWNCMDEKDKQKYIVQAFRTPKKYNQSRQNQSGSSLGPKASMESAVSMDSAVSMESLDSM